MSASGKKVRAFSQSRAQKARMQVSLLSIGSICRGEMQALQQHKTLWELASQLPQVLQCRV
ncbi:hypothetical protein DBR45_21305 [Pseudomonas sp. HMWF031]|nr:hypothetical protein DBR45_21305 [Pseudomonas sp. HMWF031]